MHDKTKLTEECSSFQNNVIFVKKKLQTHDVGHRIVNPSYYKIFNAKQSKTIESEIQINTYF